MDSEAAPLCRNAHLEHYWLLVFVSSQNDLTTVICPERSLARVSALAAAIPDTADASPTIRWRYAWLGGLPCLKLNCPARSKADSIRNLGVAEGSAGGDYAQSGTE